jgi:hypothetical protein
VRYGREDNQNARARSPLPWQQFLPSFFFAIEFLPSFLTVTLSFIAHGALIAGGRGRGRGVCVR